MNANQGRALPFMKTIRVTALFLLAVFALPLARAERPKLKVLFITGYAENAAITNGHLEPRMEVMSKPFSMDKLAARIRSIIETN